MRAIPIISIVLIGIAIALSKPWSLPDSLGDAICAGNVPSTLAHLHRGSNVNALIEWETGSGKFSTTPLLLALDHVTCSKVFPRIWVRYLVWSGADVNLPNAGGYTPLMMAAGQSDIAAASLLLSLGASVDPHDQSGKSALDIARELDDERLVALLENARPR